jgi:hypothetical protein
VPVPTNPKRARIVDNVVKPTRYGRSLYWEGSVDGVSRLAHISESLRPLPSVPDDELQNNIVTKTISDNEHLFRIVTPINIDRLAALLVNHPNPPFVTSVLRGLREGFWPWADTQHEIYPVTKDYFKPREYEEHIKQFLREQRDEEIRLNRFSESFGPDLLPGMYAMPIHVIPKPCTVNFRLITNLSAGDFAPNTMIEKSNVSNLPLDTISDLGAALIAFRRTHGNAALVMWKSDVSQAYRRMPMHKHWQMKQVHTIEGERYVDRCNNFGGKGGYGIWSTFMSLIAWIGWNILLIQFFIYVDDNFGFDRAEALMFHARLGRRLPSQQARLLDLWDDIGLPYEDRKQEFGPTLRIIGFVVDPNAMTVTIPDDARTKFLSSISEFINIVNTDRRRTLREFQALAGYANWAFNVYPLGRPGLSSLYGKITGKSRANARIYLNSSIIRELSWLSNYISTAPPVRIFSATSWDPVEARSAGLHQLEVFTDASSIALAYYFPALGLAYHAQLPPNSPSDTIFWYEALAVCSAINHAANVWARDFSPKLDRLLVSTDNMNTVHMFDSLHAKPSYNPLLLSSINARIKSSLDVRVRHVPGGDNVIADAISREKFSAATSLIPDLTILPFTPPRDALGAPSQ